MAPLPKPLPPRKRAPNSCPISMENRSKHNRQGTAGMQNHVNLLSTQLDWFALARPASRCRQIKRGDLISNDHNTTVLPRHSSLFSAAFQCSYTYTSLPPSQQCTVLLSKRHPMPGYKLGHVAPLPSLISWLHAPVSPIRQPNPAACRECAPPFQQHRHPLVAVRAGAVAVGVW